MINKQINKTVNTIVFFVAAAFITWMFEGFIFFDWNITHWSNWGRFFALIISWLVADRIDEFYIENK